MQGAARRLTGADGATLVLREGDECFAGRQLDPAVVEAFHRLDANELVRPVDAGPQLGAVA